VSKRLVKNHLALLLCFFVRSDVVRRTEDGDESPLREEFISVLDDLMRSADEVEVMLLEKLCDDVASEREAHSAIVLAPPFDVLVRVAPQQVADDAAVGNVGRAGDAADLIHRRVLGRQTAVNAGTRSKQESK